MSDNIGTVSNHTDDQEEEVEDSGITLDYGKKEFWEKKYEEEKIFDWYQDYVSLKPVITKYMPKDKWVLVVGSGNSKVSEDMAKDGYHFVANVDIAHIVVQQMQRRSTYLGLDDRLNYMTMDVRALGIKDHSVDCVLDKGTLDALACSQNYLRDIPLMCKEMYRVLKKGGLWMIITFSDPNGRMEYFEDKNFDWNVQSQEVIRDAVVEGEQPARHWVHIITKQ
eukprot:TRINITY_DN3661_c0_g1_i1.p1 TRINITY_DN3661_c0_g1~~TRINITY_DN3661_c0_g1_i1.p1  ORF type:complete len:223 (+),score=42.82 TRINITY_DN3661_c0_g1_i1:45-713(+)